jgi:hypothetical protein
MDAPIGVMGSDITSAAFRRVKTGNFALGSVSVSQAFSDMWTSIQGRGV